MTAMFYAQFLFLDCNDAAAARKVYDKALRKWPSLRYLWEGALHFEEHCLEEGRTGGSQSYHQKRLVVEFCLQSACSIDSALSDRCFWLPAVPVSRTPCPGFESSHPKNLAQV